MTEYQIQAPTRRCQLSGRELRPGEKYHSALIDDGMRLVRQDYALDAWTGPPSGTLGHWVATVPLAGEAQRRPPIDDEMLLECFQRLESAQEIAQVQFRYVLALLLMRRKRFKFEDVRKDGFGETLMLRDARNGASHAVLDPGLSEEAMSTVQDEVFRVLGWS